MWYILIFLLLFENNKMPDIVNHESSEYVGEKCACLSLHPMHLVTVLSGFWGVSVCYYLKPNNTIYLDFLEGRRFLLISFTFRIPGNSWTDLFRNLQLAALLWNPLGFSLPTVHSKDFFRMQWITIFWLVKLSFIPCICAVFAVLNA